MAIYKTKPFKVEAVKFTGDNFDELVAFTGSRTVEPGWDIQNFQEAGTYVMWDDDEIVAEVWDYLHSTWVGVKVGQYIIKGGKGEFYPCDPDIFHSKYELDDGETSDNQTVTMVINNCVDPERVAAEVIKQLRTRRRRGDRPAG